ncbi:MAG: hypothetical protein AAF589_01500 [Planctomycetota bacterium]
MKCTLTVFSIVAIASIVGSEAIAQPGGFGGRGGRGGPGNPFGVAGLLMSDQVREEIELLDDQQAELDAMRDEMREELGDRMRSLFGGIRDLPQEERRAAMEDARSEMASIRDDIESRVKEVLMPHQFERLRQIEMQQEMQRGGTMSVTRGRVAEELGITDEQREQMQQKAQEEQQKLEEKIRELRAEARESILSVLTSDQRAKYDELVGKPFEMQRPEGGRGGFGGRGGPGGGGFRGGDRRSPRGSDRPEIE